MGKSCYQSGMQALREQISNPAGRSFRVLRWSRSISAAELLLGPGRAVKMTGAGGQWHFHVETELTLFLSGEGTRFAGDHLGPFAAGDLILLGEKLPHYWDARGASSGISVQWHFPQTHPFWAFPENLALAALFKQAGRGIRFTGRTAAAVTELMQRLTVKDGADQLAVLLQILARLARAPKPEQSVLSAKSFALAPGSEHEKAITQAMSHLIANYRDEVRLGDVLELTAMSRATFSRQFRKHSGRTFSEFLNRLRLQAACRELQATDRGVLDIALSCGFSQLSFFNRLFRRLMNATPTEYRVKSRKVRRGAPH